MGGGLEIQAMPIGLSLLFRGLPAQVSLGVVTTTLRVRGLKLEMLEKYLESQTPTVHGWLNMME